MPVDSNVSFLKMTPKICLSHPYRPKNMSKIAVCLQFSIAKGVRAQPLPKGAFFGKPDFTTRGQRFSTLLWAPLFCVFIVLVTRSVKVAFCLRISMAKGA